MKDENTERGLLREAISKQIGWGSLGNWQ